MSDVMLFGVLRMPYEMAMGSELSRRQFYARAQEAAERLQSVEAQPAAVAGEAVVIPRKLGWAIYGLLAQECAPCAEPECRISSNPEALITQCREQLYPLIRASAPAAPAAPLVGEPSQQNSFHRSAADASDASGSAIPARPTLSDEQIKAAWIRAVEAGNFLDSFERVAARFCRTLFASHWPSGGKAPGGDQKAAPLHPSSVQAVDGDEPTPYKTLYYELLYAVGQKFPGETRHQTALRYIHERETASSTSSGAAMKDN